MCCFLALLSHSKLVFLHSLCSVCLECPDLSITHSPSPFSLLAALSLQDSAQYQVSYEAILQLEVITYFVHLLPTQMFVMPVHQVNGTAWNRVAAQLLLISLVTSYKILYNTNYSWFKIFRSEFFIKSRSGVENIILKSGYLIAFTTPRKGVRRKCSSSSRKPAQ